MLPGRPPLPSSAPSASSLRALRVFSLARADHQLCDAPGEAARVPRRGAFGEQGTSTGVNGSQTYSSDYSDAGAAYVFSRNGGTWSQRSYVKATNTEPFDEFGVRVGLSADGNVLAVAADLESSAATGVGGNQQDNAAPEAGAVYVY